MLLGSNDTITMLGNYIHHTSGRSPHAGGYAGVMVSSHFVNNYYDDEGGHVIDPEVGANLLFEGNYSQDATTPFATKSGVGNAYGPLASTIATTNTVCTSALGRVCGANVVGQSDATAILDSAALTAFQGLRASLVTAYPATEVPYCVQHLAGPGHI